MIEALSSQLTALRATAQRASAQPAYVCTAVQAKEQLAAIQAFHRTFTPTVVLALIDAMVEMVDQGERAL